MCRGEFYRQAVMMLREAEPAETAMRHRLSESTGTVAAPRPPSPGRFRQPRLAAVAPRLGPAQVPYTPRSISTFDRFNALAN